jgi:hypothetical protein
MHVVVCPCCRQSWMLEPPDQLDVYTYPWYVAVPSHPSCRVPPPLLPDQTQEPPLGEMDTKIDPPSAVGVPQE